MSGPNRKREVQVNFRVSPQELEMIEQKMVQLHHIAVQSHLAQIGFPVGCAKLCLLYTSFLAA